MDNLWLIYGYSMDMVDMYPLVMTNIAVGNDIFLSCFMRNSTISMAIYTIAMLNYRRVELMGLPSSIQTASHKKSMKKLLKRRNGTLSSL